jgi:CDK-activating kinase assembly factor MAT1
MEREEREARAQALRREEDEERAARESERMALIDRLETSDKDAAAVVARARAEAERRRNAAAGSTILTQSGSRLLRTRAARSTAIPDVPHIALNDDYYAYGDKYTLRASYSDPFSEAVRRDRDGIMRAGGYRVEEAWERALRCAVAGLDLAPLSGLETPAEEVHTAVDSGGDVVMASA